ncbi:type III-B CRISPR module RAMP protein Cmr4 [Candidatus Bathyarchaeota archaeon A05DMB-2]|jgi:CRISPR-associated protein Cmr4|nr:type III-B CRISPR module RAMP protein Cmr4 [Candidatus Bathyarchaeota archaeon A05DMB-2]MBT0160442.1 type III-B CRISPR module RAMP protein Cmr4 [Candidatus Bathyarchaeota archaeon A05DMB-2]
MNGYERKTYFGMAVDPIHVGTGGYTLGRADNPILRDFDGIPKIPGTSIEGTARTYAYFQGLGKNQACAKGKKTKETQPCGNCPLCVSFGYATDNNSRQGMAIFSDAKILFFPVASLVGPVWVTSPSKLNELNIPPETAWQNMDKNETAILSNYLLKQKLKNTDYINFGWLLLSIEKSNNEKINHNISVDTVFGEYKFNARGFDKQDIFDRLAIVSDSVLHQIVNSNLEVRTSVSINPETGAAEEGALFTYEAIPRGTILYFTMTYQNPKHFGVESKNLNDVVSTVESSFELFEFLGVGGMGTRGFGKLKMFGLDKRYDPIAMAQIRANNLQEQIKEIDEKLKTTPAEEQAKLQQEKEKKLQLIKETAEEHAKIAEIYKALR